MAKKNRYIVRLWVDVEIPASTPEEAKQIADRVQVSTVPFITYDVQTDRVLTNPS